MNRWPMTLDGRAFEAREGETLLDACCRSALAIPFSCRAGVCQGCLLQSLEGPVAPAAQKGLPRQLAERNYLLACQCVPSGPMVLRRAAPADRAVDGLLLGAAQAGPSFIHVSFETARELACGAGDRLAMSLQAGGDEVELTLTAAWPAECRWEALCAVQPAAQRLLDLEFGAPLSVRGPLEPGPEGPELEAPSPDPQLWRELGEGETVGAVLRAFYEQVYRDERLAGFFEGVTLQRSVEKQYSFLKQLMTGERVYFGDRPRNAHHWMVISHELFDYRQALMRAQLQAHGLSDAQIARWMRLEVHWRRDIVKSHAWPRRVGGVDLPLDGYAREVLSAGTLCDHCGGELQAGTEVHYHLRLGKVSCEGCVSA